MELRFVLPFLIPILIVLAIDFYAFQAFRTVFQSSTYRTLIYILYWAVSFVTIFFFLSTRVFHVKAIPHTMAAVFGAIMVIALLSKIVIVLFLLGEDISRGIRFVMSKFSSSPPASAPAATGITRSEFLNKAAIIAAAVPFGTLVYGIVANAYNYQYRKVSIKFPNLPEAFNGFKIIQLSDIHSGSFNRTEPLINAVNHINDMNADVILFTGDLVNNVADEMENYMGIFNKLRAKHGVISVTGNHDYADYVFDRRSPEWIENLQKFKNVHKNLGWDLLLNEHRVLERDGQKIAILGIENWGKGNFSKYGKMDLAHKGTEEIPFKVLMSHDPSHWDAQVRPKYPDVDLTLSGHTHGFQFGIESKWLKWSPSQWIYKQWAGLYQEGKQYIYVNRGFGFLGYPGRVGILPEVTEITLLKG